MTRKPIDALSAHLRPIMTSLLVALGALTLAARSASLEPRARAEFKASLDPAEVVGPAGCSECHESETEVWQASTHHLGAKTLSRNEQAREMAGALGIKRIKNDARCAQCHYTVQSDGEKQKSIAGASCESCHGSAGPWLELHNEFGGADVTSANESAEHQAQRLGRCDEAGMIRPGLIYALAGQCQSCHTIGSQEVVEVGGHAVPTDFEFVAWSQGDIRHNFVRGASENAISEPQRLRLMFVLGHAAGLEAALRALGGATAQGEYASAMAKLAQAELKALADIQAALETSEVGTLLELQALDLSSADSAALNDAADRVRAAALAFEAAHDGADLEPLDALLPKQYGSGR